MKVVLATGIYPPEIGGPATYVRALATALRAKGATVSVVAYGESNPNDAEEHVTRVSRSGGPIGRYIRYARTLRRVAAGADIIEAFSSVSVGVPLWLSHIRGPKKVLRLGGDFLWERATDRGDARGLHEWYEERPSFLSTMNGILRTFDMIVFSTAFQEDLYRKVYHNMPHTTVIENVCPPGHPVLHKVHTPVKLLFLGRFVAFKNLVSLIDAVKNLPTVTLTFVGSGPTEEALRTRVRQLALVDRVTFLPPQHGAEKEEIFRDHDLLVLPSRTELSPNTALEARAAGLPVLLTEETGLSRNHTEGMILAPLRTPEEITRALEGAIARYEMHAAKAAEPLPERSWTMLADEHLSLFTSLL